MLKGPSSLPTADAAVEDILYQLKLGRPTRRRQRPGQSERPKPDRLKLDWLKIKTDGELHRIIREQIESARNFVKDWEANPYDFSRLQGVRAAAKRAQKAINQLIKEAQDAELFTDPFPVRPLCDALRKVELWQVWALHSRSDVRQRAAAHHAKVIIELCSNDKPKSTDAGRLHLIARAIYQEIWGSLKNDKESTALQRVCQKLLKGEGGFPSVYIGYRSPRRR